MDRFRVNVRLRCNPYRTLHKVGQYAVPHLAASGWDLVQYNSASPWTPRFYTTSLPTRDAICAWSSREYIQVGWSLPPTAACAQCRVPTFSPAPSSFVSPRQPRAQCPNTLWAEEKSNVFTLIKLFQSQKAGIGTVGEKDTIRFHRIRAGQVQL